MSEQNYRPLILQVSWRRMIVLLTGCSLALSLGVAIAFGEPALHRPHIALALGFGGVFGAAALLFVLATIGDRKSTRLNSSHGYISYAVFCLKKKKKKQIHSYTYTFTKR